MFHTVLILCNTLGAWSDDAPPGRQEPHVNQPAVAPDVLLLDRLHQTFVRLNEVVLPAYLDHFRDEPKKLYAIQAYANRLYMTQHRLFDDALLSPDQLPFKLPFGELSSGPDSPVVQMRQAHQAARRSDAEELSGILVRLGSAPHLILTREQPEQAGPLTAACPLYDGALLWAHRRLAELRGNSASPAEPENVARQIAELHGRLRDLRAQPHARALSLRKFLDENRGEVWRLGWLYRWRALEQEKEKDSARAHASLMRAWAIGDALFPAADRGRLGRFDPLFLAELGDVYARLERYDLMLRYMYSEQGLPARFDMARPVAELARIAESVRLARPSERPSEQMDETFPETVGQILFEQPVPVTGGAQQITARVAPARRLAAVCIGAGAVLIAAAIVMLARRSSRRPAQAAANAVEPSSSR